jgi:ankyrin repeat protein
MDQQLVMEFVIAGHGNLARVRELLERNPALLNEAYAWTDTDRETAIQGAAQVGSAKVAEYLLSKGAPLDICTAAMLGKESEVKNFLDNDPALINANGAHGIPLLTHAALSGNASLVKMLVSRGATAGLSSALFNAASRGHYDVAKWLLENTRPDVAWKNYEGKTALMNAEERKDDRMRDLLRVNGAVDDM